MIINGSHTRVMCPVCHTHIDGDMMTVIQKQLKKAKKRKELPDEARIRAFSDQDHMWKLRLRFVRQAKKYFGVPYARKYWTSEGKIFR